MCKITIKGVLVFTISSIKIRDIWGHRNMYTELFDSVNVFIGQNGSGKTTLMNIIYGVLTVNNKILYRTNFKSIDLRLKNGKLTRKIFVEISEHSEVVRVKYKIGTQIFEFPMGIDEYSPRNRRMHPKYGRVIEECKKEIENLISINWLSVHRELLDSDRYNEERSYRRNVELFKPSIDIKIEDLLNKLTEYYLNIELQAKKLSVQYQTDVLAGLLFNEAFDKFSLEKDSDIEPESIRDDLKHAYSDLNSLNPKVEKRIDKHIDAISRSLLNIEKTIKSKQALNLNDVLPLVLLRRTTHIIELSKRLEVDRNHLFTTFNLYIELLSKFIKDKKIELSPGARHPLRISKNEMNLNLSDLSSGEKQLFILFTETLLQNNEKFIFIADEPELSLHIEWQKKLLGAIQELNPNSQVIVATHSPEIAALWRSGLIKMETIIE